MLTISLTPQVESWPCDLHIPDLPRTAMKTPGAAVLGQKPIIYIIITIMYYLYNNWGVGWVT